MSAPAFTVLAREADEHVFHGTGVPHFSAGDISAETKMWRAVLYMCWADAFINSDWVLIGKCGQSDDKAYLAERERTRARRWLTFDYGDWQEDRELVCDLAGVDADLVRKLALAKLAQVKAQESTEPEESVDHDALATHARVDLDKMLAQLLSRSGELNGADVDSLLADLAETETEQVLAASA